MKYVYDVHKIMLENKLILVYEGEFTQDIVKSVLTMAEKNLDHVGEEYNVKKKVFNVAVECLQNICKHADKALQNNAEKSAIFMISKHVGYYKVVSGNTIDNDTIFSLRGKLELINSLDKEGLKQLYKDMLLSTELSDRGGAGLGFIDIARKSGHKLEFHFEPIDNTTSFFCFSTKIKRIND